MKKRNKYGTKSNKTSGPASTWSINLVKMPDLPLLPLPLSRNITSFSFFSTDFTGLNGGEKLGKGGKRTNARILRGDYTQFWSASPTITSRRLYPSSCLVAGGREETLGGSHPLSLPSFALSDEFHGPTGERGHRREGRACTDEGANSGELDHVWG